MRKRLALVLLGALALICLGYAWKFAPWSFRAASVPLTFALLYVAVAVGVYRERAWARWIGVGLAMSAVFLQIVLVRIGFSFEPSHLVFVFLPAALVCALGDEKDSTPRPIRSTWFLAGATLLPVVFVGYDALYCTLDAGNANPLAVFAVALALTGIFGLARSRTWGLLATTLGGLVLFFSMPTPPVWGGVMLHTREVMRGISLGLVCVFLPLALPAWRYLRRPN